MPYSVTSVSSASIRFNYTVSRDNNGVTMYTGVETIEVLMFNCPMRGIGASSITVLEDGSMVGTLERQQNLTSCNCLVRVSADTILSF